MGYRDRKSRRAHLFLVMLPWYHRVRVWLKCAAMERRPRQIDLAWVVTGRVRRRR